MSESNFQLLLKAESLTEIERWQEAAPLLLQYLAKNPQDYQATCLLSLCYFHLEQTDSALEYANRAVANDPEEEWAHRLRSIILSQLGKKQESFQAAEEAVRLAPNQVFALHTLVMAYLDANKNRKAKEIAEKMRENHPYTDESFFALGSVYLQMNNPYEAEKCFREALRINPSNSLARNNLGVAVLRQEVRQATKINQPDTITLFGNEKNDDAMSHFTEAIKLEPNNELILENLKSQFSYSPFINVCIGLIPFTLMSFFIIPAGTILMILISFVSLLKLAWEVRKRKQSAPPEIQIFLKSVKQKSFAEYFAELKRIIILIFTKTWQPHLLALFAVILNFIALSQNQNATTNTPFKAIAFILIIVSGVWLSIKLSRD